LAYRINGGVYQTKSLASHPAHEAVDGDLKKVKVVDPTPDGGGLITKSLSGRPIHTEHFPTRAKRVGGSLTTFPHLQVDQFYGSLMADDEVKSIIEGFEPDIHQFMPLEVSIGRDVVNRRYAVNVCKRMDMMNRSLTYPINERGFYKPYGSPESRLVLSRQAVEGHHLWHDKYLVGTFVSDELAAALRTAEVTGLHLSERIDEQ
jgi:hypothetical protein